jgi:hypothetical protein
MLETLYISRRYTMAQCRYKASYIITHPSEHTNTFHINKNSIIIQLSKRNNTRDEEEFIVFITLTKQINDRFTLNFTILAGATLPIETANQK